MERLSLYGERLDVGWEGLLGRVLQTSAGGSRSDLAHLEIRGGRLSMSVSAARGGGWKEGGGPCVGGTQRRIASEVGSGSLQVRHETLKTSSKAAACDNLA